MAYVTAALKSFISIFGKKIKIILAVFAAIAALLLVLALLLGLAHLARRAVQRRNTIPIKQHTTKAEAGALNGLPLLLV